MTAFTYWGVTVDPDELREVAALADQDSPDLAARLRALPRATLTGESVACGPARIAQRLRSVAAFLERRQRGVAFGQRVPEREAPAPCADDPFWLGFAVTDWGAKLAWSGQVL